MVVGGSFLHTSGSWSNQSGGSRWALLALPQSHVGTHVCQLRCSPESLGLAGRMGSEGPLVLWGVMMLEGLRDPPLTGPV